MAGNQEVTLHGAWFSPWVLRARVALEMKGINPKYIEENLANKSSLLLEVNPIFKKVPVLVHKGRSIIESSVILEYIDDEWAGGPSFLPRDRIQKAQARFWAKFFDGKLGDAMWKACFSKEEKEKEKAIEAIKESLDILEKELEGKKFFGGDSIGLVDITASYLGYYFPIMQEIVGLKLWTEAQYPNLFKWAGVFCEEDSVAKYLPEKERLVKFFKRYMETGILYHAEDIPSTQKA